MMLTLFQQQLARFFPQHTDFLIGLSGGVDSVALLHLFVQARSQRNLTLRAVHIHHGLSPNADAWAAFCRQLCTQWDVPCEVRKVQVGGTQGLEGNARHARYQAVADFISATEIFATAHHLDDQAETFFLALKRGSGVKGLSAMQAVSYRQNFTLFRPLLNASKADLLAYAVQHNLDWVDDESNADTDFDRNFLRQNVLPLLNARWAHFNQMVARSGQHCQEQQQLLEELLRPEFEQCFEQADGSLDIHRFPTFSTLKQRQLIRLWLARCSEPMPTREQLNAVLSQMIAAPADKQPQVQLGEKQIRRYQQRLYIVKPLPTIAPTAYPLPPMIEGLRLPHSSIEIRRQGIELICQVSHQTHRLSLPQALGNETLTLCFGVTGKVAIYGKTQREQMKKIYQQYHIPPWQRPHTPVICWQGQFVGLITISHQG